MDTSSVIRVLLFTEVNSKLGAPFLELLAAHPRVDLAGVVTSPPGRLCSYFVDDPLQVDVEARARELGVPVLRPQSVNAPQTLDAIRGMRADYFIVGNYQQIMKAPLLSLPARTAVNFHPSPLPRYAGLAPFYWMVRHGERDGAVTAIEMTTGIDEGPILLQRPMPLTGRETALELRVAQEEANVRMLGDLVPMLADGTFVTSPQDISRRSYYGRPTDRDYAIDFSDPVEEIGRVVRAGYRSPGAHTVLPGGRRLVILSVDDAADTYLAPPDAPGRVAKIGSGVFVSARDGWVRVLTVELDGDEVPAQSVGELLAEGVLLTVSTPRAATA